MMLRNLFNSVDSPLYTCRGYDGCSDESSSWQGFFTLGTAIFIGITCCRCAVDYGVCCLKRNKLKKNYVYKGNKGRIGYFFLPAGEEQVLAIDSFLGSATPKLSVAFFDDVRSFDASFSRGEIAETAEKGDE